MSVNATGVDDVTCTAVETTNRLKSLIDQIKVEKDGNTTVQQNVGENITAEFKKLFELLIVRKHNGDITTNDFGRGILQGIATYISKALNKDETQNISPIDSHQGALEYSKIQEHEEIPQQKDAETKTKPPLLHHNQSEAECMPMVDAELEEKLLPDKKQKRSIKQVQVLIPLPSGATDFFFNSLQLKLTPWDIELIHTDVKSVNEDSINTNLILTICNNHSRLSADVTNTLKNITETRRQRIFLVVLHCKEETSLPGLKSKGSHSCLNIPEVLDMACNINSREIYDCDMNKNAFAAIANLIESGRLVFQIKADD